MNYFAQVTSMWLLNIECSYVNVDAKHWNMVLHNKLKLRNVNVKHKAESKIWADYIKLCYIIIEPSLWIILLCLDGVVFNLVWWLCFVCRQYYSHSINARKDHFETISCHIIINRHCHHRSLAWSLKSDNSSMTDSRDVTLITVMHVSS